MKKSIIIFFAILSLINNAGKAQNLIAVQNGSNSTFYSSLNSAIMQAQNGDTVYVPGGSWNIGTLHINKSLSIIGTGYNPDSSQASGVCYFLGNIFLEHGCSMGSLTGIYLQGDIYHADSSDIINSFKIYRCRLSNIDFSNNSSFWYVKENVIEGNIDGIYGIAHDNIFLNNIIGGVFMRMGFNNIINNNIFIGVTYAIGSWNYFPYVSNCVLKNNIFLSSTPIGYSNNNLFYNNLFVENITFPYGSNYGANNFVAQTQSSIFINQTGNTFNYTHDYHLKLSCPGKNAGTDGTDLGIYGTVNPFKVGALPYSPHIQFKSVGTETSIQGTLPVNIKVEAQDH